MNTPVVSVVMSVFNGLQYLPSAIKSILNQSFRDFEFIIIDDGSTDGASEYLDAISTNDKRIKILHQENMGLGFSLNRGLLLSKGKYVARMDADDISHHNRLAMQVEYMENRPDISMSSTGAVFFDDQEKFVYSIHQMPDDNEKLVSMMEKGENPFIHGAVIIRANIYRSMKEGYRLPSAVQDFDLWLRMSTTCKFGVVEKVLYGYRVSPGSTGVGSLSRESDISATVLKLHRERKNYGKEISDWRELTFKERSYAKKNLANQLQRDDVAKYVRALHWLKVGNYKKFYNLMKQLTISNSVYFKKAKRLVFLYPLSAPLWQITYYLKKIRSKSGTYIKTAFNNKIPEFISRYE